MQLSSAPTKIEAPFAHAGTRNTIPQSTATPGAAAYDTGFPPVTAQPVSSGGIPPAYGDFQGILHDGGSVIEQWASAGAGWPFDSVYAAAIGGYPKGARLVNAAGTGYWLSIIDNNSNDPDAGGAGWIPDSKVFASVYASAQQTLALGNSKVLWDTVEQDTFSLWDAGNARFTAKWPGFYRLSGGIYLPSPDAQNLSVAVYKNGILAKNCSQFPQVSDVPLSYPFDAAVLCAAGDYLETFMTISEMAVLAGQVGSNQAYVFGQIEYMGN